MKIGMPLSPVVVCTYVWDYLFLGEAWEDDVSKSWFNQLVTAFANLN
jgi:hypothetical protein